MPGQDFYTGMGDCFKKIVANEGYVIGAFGREHAWKMREQMRQQCLLRI